jgi:hypothetical protein
MKFCFQFFEFFNNILFTGNTLYSSWLRSYATSLKVAGSVSDKVIEFLSCLILPAALWFLARLSL